MQEVERIPWNGYTAVSTFSGAGGSCLGYRMAGFRLAWASEFIRSAADVYRANHPTSALDTRDIREVAPQDILDAADAEVGTIDVFDGSPPCSDFSTAGKGSKGWGDVKTYSETKQRVDDLFFEYIRLIDGVRPRVFVAENVEGLVRGAAKGYFKTILRKMRAIGYRVEARVLDSQWLGVPQRRKRLIFVGVRSDLDVDPVFPSPFAYRYAIRDAIGDLRADVEDDAWIDGYAIGAEWSRLAEGEQSDKYFSLVRPDRFRPCPTITQTGRVTGAASVTHPTERRKFSIAELKRLMGFPDDFRLSGTYAQQWERLARAVPPLMMRAIAQTVRDEILDATPTPRAPSRPDTDRSNTDRSTNQTAASV
jgi:DNA (cytosine-5)-methyltransferase 1